MNVGRLGHNFTILNILLQGLKCIYVCIKTEWPTNSAQFPIVWSRIKPG